MSEIDADPKAGEPGRPRTAIGRFLEHRGVLIVKETREIGALKCERGARVAAETMTLATARGGRTMLGKTFGVRLEATLGEGATRSAILDLDELGEFLDAIRVLHEAALRMSPLKTDHTEATYTTRDLIQVGFHQSTEQDQLGFLRLGEGDDFCFFPVASLPSLARLIEAARSYLLLKGAGATQADLPGDRG